MIEIFRRCLLLFFIMMTANTVHAANTGNTIQPTVQEVTVPVDQLHIRDEPSIDGKIIAFADRNDKLQIAAVSANWYEVELDQGTGYIFKELLDTSSTPLKTTSIFEGKQVVIDAGHGGRDVGAVGHSDTYEKNMTALTANELQYELEALGVTVHQTRPGNQFIPLTSRPTYANLLGADAFISIHYNSTLGLPAVSGIETFFHGEHNEPLATNIHKGLIRHTDAMDRGIATSDYQVLRLSLQPAVLLELGFISNAETEEKLLTTGYQRQLVNGIVTGLGKYFSKEK